MLRKIILTSILIITFLIQTTWLGAIELAGIKPNLLIVLVFMVGFIRGKKEGLWVGFFAGFLIDIFFGYSGIIGLNALIYMYIGYSNGYFNRMFYYEEITLPVVLLVISQFSYSIFIYFIAFLLRNKLDIGYYMINVILPELTYTLIVTLFVYRPFIKLSKWIERKEKRGEKQFV